jgi:chemotaxis protein CheX
MTCMNEPITLPEIGSAICAAAQEVFSVMLGIDLTSGDAQMGRSCQQRTGVAHSGVVAVLGLTGAWGGSGEVSIESALALEIASRLLLSKYDVVDEEVLDAIAEVANMIVGNVKTALEHTLGAMGMSAPAVFFGGEFETRVVGNPNMVLVPFACGEGTLTVQVAVAPVAPARVRNKSAKPQLVPPALVNSQGNQANGE